MAAKHVKIDKEKVARFASYSKSIHNLAEDVKVSAISDSVRAKVERISEYADEMHHELNLEL